MKDVRVINTRQLSLTIGRVEPEQSRSILSIPDYAVNMLDRVPTLQKLYKGFKVPGYLIAKFRSHAPTFDVYQTTLRNLGERVGIVGPTVYYPFICCDVLTPHLLSDKIRDVFGVRLEPAGKIEEAEKILSSAIDNPEGCARALQYWQFDQVGLLADWFSRGETFLALSLFRIAVQLKLKITGIYYFNVKGENLLEFYRQGNSNETFDHVVVEAIDRKGISRRFWFVKQSLSEKDLNFERLISNLEFQTLLLKGGEAIVECNRSSTVYRNVLARARELNSRVAIDYKSVDVCVWRPGYKSERVEHSFNLGYGSTFYFGSGSNLASELEYVKAWQYPQT